MFKCADGTTVQQFFAERVPNGKPQDYLIRVNRQPVARQPGVAGRRPSEPTPTKIEGASYRRFSVAARTCRCRAGRIGRPSLFFPLSRIPMTLTNKVAMRAAVLIHEQLARAESEMCQSICPNTPGTTFSGSSDKSP